MGLSPVRRSPPCPRGALAAQERPALWAGRALLSSASSASWPRAASMPVSRQASSEQPAIGSMVNPHATSLRAHAGCHPADFSVRVGDTSPCPSSPPAHSHTLPLNHRLLSISLLAPCPLLCFDLLEVFAYPWAPCLFSSPPARFLEACLPCLNPFSALLYSRCCPVAPRTRR